MNTRKQQDTSANKGACSSEEALVHFDAFINACASKVVHTSSRNLSSDELYQLKQEVAQNTRIKIWVALRKRKIEHIKAYIMRTAYHEYISIVRQNKHFVQMLMDENGEPVQDFIMVMQGEYFGDPGCVFEQRVAVEERMVEFAKAVKLLHSRQQRAIICSLKEKVDDAISLKNALEAQNIDINTTVWPDDEADKKLLKASVSAARRNIAQFMGIVLPRK